MLLYSYFRPLFLPRSPLQPDAYQLLKTNITLVGRSFHRICSIHFMIRRFGSVWSWKVCFCSILASKWFRDYALQPRNSEINWFQLNFEKQPTHLYSFISFRSPRRQVLWEVESDTSQCRQNICTIANGPFLSLYLFLSFSAASDDDDDVDVDDDDNDDTVMRALCCLMFNNHSNHFHLNWNSHYYFVCEFRHLAISRVSFKTVDIDSSSWQTMRIANA